jgi:histidyl-tRNA synthetase
MNLKPTKPLSGIVELTPIQQRFFDEAARRMQNVLKTAGFSHLELPALERAEVLTDKENWDEIETQIYMFEKGDTKMGLRYDGTIGLARYVAGHMNDLIFPFREYQFAKNYRGERPQKGRYREFWQMDLDILGIGELSENYDAEIIAVMSKMYESIEEFVGPIYVRIGNRKFWNAVFEYLNVDDEKARAAFILIDKLDKMSLEDFKIALADIIGAEAAGEVILVFSEGYKSLLNKNIKIDSAINSIEKFMKLLTDMGVKNAKLDLSIMRGHGYYTGVVFEFFSERYPELRSIGGGGRYEDLVDKFSKTKIVGTGAAVGFSRMIVPLLEDGAIDLSQFEQYIDAAVLILSEENISYAARVLFDFRAAGITATPHFDTDKKIKTQMEFANKIKARYSIIVGDDEVKDNVVSLKNMSTGEQIIVPVERAIKIVSATPTN